MTLNTLKEVTSIGEFVICREFYLGIPVELEHVLIDDDRNLIAFRLQNGSIKEHGVNGCQADTIIEAAMMILEGLNEQVQCVETSMAINKLEEALLWLERRGVEGTDDV